MYDDHVTEGVLHLHIIDIPIIRTFRDEARELHRGMFEYRIM